MKVDFALLSYHAELWIRTAAPAQLWDVINNGGLDAKAGFPGASLSFGDIAGPGPYGESLATREWAKDATGDLAEWFLGNVEAQEEAPTGADLGSERVRL